MRILLDRGAFMPTRAHETDAGLDLMTPHPAFLASGGKLVIDTGVHIELPTGYFGKIESKSGLNVNYGIVSCGGVIDEGYQGSIAVALYNLSKDMYVFEAGDKIAQLIIQPYAAPELELVSWFDVETERGSAGFGSTGR